eukprot:scaffold6655_cov169-Amphora_coffeaeformis.AAC.31
MAWAPLYGRPLWNPISFRYYRSCIGKSLRKQWYDANQVLTTLCNGEQVKGVWDISKAEREATDPYEEEYGEINIMEGLESVNDERKEYL